MNEDKTYFNCDRCGKRIERDSDIRDVEKTLNKTTGGFILCDRCLKVAIFDRDIPIL